MARHRHYVSPAIAARYNTNYEADEWGITTDVAEMIGNKRELEEGIKVMRKMRAAGIKILPFGDYGFAWLRTARSRAIWNISSIFFGFEPWEALRAATAYSGEAWAGETAKNSGAFAKDISRI